jgi:hypothetical protein
MVSIATRTTTTNVKSRSMKTEQVKEKVIKMKLTEEEEEKIFLECCIEDCMENAKRMFNKKELMLSIYSLEKAIEFIELLETRG